MRRVVWALLQRGGHDLELPVRSAGRVPTTGHDALVELIVTPDRGLAAGWRVARARWERSTGPTDRGEDRRGPRCCGPFRQKAAPTEENVRM